MDNSDSLYSSTLLNTLSMASLFSLADSTTNSITLEATHATASAHTPVPHRLFSTALLAASAAIVTSPPAAPTTRALVSLEMFVMSFFWSTSPYLLTLIESVLFAH